MGDATHKAGRPWGQECSSAWSALEDSVLLPYLPEVVKPWQFEDIMDNLPGRSRRAIQVHLTNLRKDRGISVRAPRDNLTDDERARLGSSELLAALVRAGYVPNHVGV